MVSSIPPTLDELQPGDVIADSYRIEKKLGRGAMGTVYLARDLELEREVAVKVIGARRARDAAANDAFRREAALLARVRSDYVVQVHAFLRHQGAPLFVMEHARGTSLDMVIERHGAHESFVPVQRAITLLRQIATGLGDLHRAGIVHRDVKPANVIIEKGTGRPMLIDLGLAAVRAGAATPKIGTPFYMAPELSWPSPPPPEPTIDVYSLGVTAFELVTGRRPFVGHSAPEVFRQHAEDPVPLLTDHRRRVGALQGLVERAMAKRPEDRYEDGHAFARAVMEVAPAMRDSDVDSTASGSTFTPGREPRPMKVERGTLRVVVAEDDDVFRKFAARAAQLAFYGRAIEVRTARTGAEMLKGASQQMPHLLLLDHGLPDMSGVDVLSAVRDMPEGHLVRVVVATGTLPGEARWRFEVLGVEHILEKPVELKQLVELLQSIASSEGWIEKTSVAP